MSERESASPQHDPDARLGDLFENLPDPTQQQLPTVDDSAPAPGSRRAAREAASAARPEAMPAGSPAVPSEPSAAPIRASADDAGLASPSTTPVRDSADAVGAPDAGDTPTRALPQVPPVSGDPQPVLGGGLDDLFAPHEDEHASSRAPKKKRRTGCLVALIIVLVIVGGIAATGVWVMNTYGDKINEAMGWGEPKDWEAGLATGEALVTISEGDTGAPVSTKLFEAGVTKTEDVFYDYLVAEAPDITF